MIPHEAALRTQALMGHHLAHWRRVRSFHQARMAKRMQRHRLRINMVRRHGQPLACQQATGSAELKPAASLGLLLLKCAGWVTDMHSLPAHCPHAALLVTLQHCSVGMGLLRWTEQSIPGRGC